MTRWFCIMGHLLQKRIKVLGPVPVFSGCTEMKGLGGSSGGFFYEVRRLTHTGSQPASVFLYPQGTLMCWVRRLLRHRRSPRSPRSPSSPLQGSTCTSHPRASLMRTTTMTFLQRPVANPPRQVLVPGWFWILPGK